MVKRNYRHQIEMNSSQRTYYNLGVGIEYAMKGDNFLTKSLSGGIHEKRLNNFKG